MYKRPSTSLISVSLYRGIQFVDKMLKSIYLLTISFVFFVILLLYGTYADDEVAIKQRDGKGGGFSFIFYLFTTSSNHEFIF